MGWACLVTLVTLGAFTVISAQPDTIHSEDSPTLTPQVYLPYVAKSCRLPEPMPIGSWEVSRNPTRGFYWPYSLYLPENLQGKQALVIPNNTGERNDDFCVHRTRAFETMIWRIPWADSLGVPLIVPVFPRFDDETDGTISSQYLGRGTLEEYWQQAYPQLARQDLQLVAMIDDARERLTSMGANIDSTVLLWGYSASSMFVSRFVALQPERVQAAAFGGHGWTIAPVAEWDGLSLPYPYGAGDLEELVGQPINLAEFKNVPIYSFMGAEDTNSWALPWYIGLENNAQQYYEAFVDKFGSSASSLMISAQEIYDSVDCSATFVLYPGTGHEITPEMDEDVIDFLNAYKEPH